MKSVYRLAGISRSPLASSALRSSSTPSTSPHCTCLRKGFSSTSATFSSIKLLSSRGFKTDSATNQAVSGSASSFSAIHDDPLFSTSFSDRSKLSSSIAATGSRSSARQTPDYLNNNTASSINTSSWSSPHDVIPRHQFFKDYSHLWTLLEACLETENFTRAEHVLISFSEHSDAKDLTLAVNSYLLRLSELNEKNSDTAQIWLRHISKKIPQFTPDTVTRAIILRNKCLHYDYDRTRISGYIEQYSAEILKHVDVLGIEMISKIVQTCNIPLSEIDPQFRNLVQAVVESSKSAQNSATPVSTEDTINSDAAPQETSTPIVAPSSNTDAARSEAEETKLASFDIDSIASLTKPGVETLNPVDSFGLKAIQHTLSGFAADSDEFSNVMEKAIPFIAEKNVDQGNYIDFFKMVEELEASNASAEEKTKFYEAFESYNTSRQKTIEKKGLEGANLKWKHSHEQMRQAGALALKPLEALLWEWNLAMQPLLEQEFSRIKGIVKHTTTRKARNAQKKMQAVEAEKVVKSAVASDPLEFVEGENEDIDISISDRFEYGPYLLVVNPQKLGILTILEILKLVSTGGIQEGMRTARAVLSVGKAVEMEYKIAKASKRENDIFNGISPESFSDKSSVSALHDKIKESNLSNQISWPSSIRAKVGSLLISLLIHVAKVPVTGKDPVTGDVVTGKAPAFFHSYQYQGGNRVGVLKVHSFLSKYISGDVPSNLLQPQLLPMLIPPRPWKSWRSGGYIYSTSSIMRVKDAPEQMAYLKAASDNGDLDAVYEGLNVLGNTSWTINTEIFKVISKVWNSGKEFLEIPNEPGTLETPPPPPRDADPQVRRNWLRECRKIHNEHTAKYSQRCDTNYKLEIARAYLGERFYLPHNMDFRGRAYPLSPHLNHLGNDLSRSMLKFWEGRRLGESGLRWLKIHTANVFGYDKFSFEEREQFIDEHMGDVFDSAENPLDGECWWQKGADPWQTLAACMELNNAMSLTNPEDYISHLPVHQDGTCNGLQHYAALGGDIEGARQVNLVPSERPQDVYSKVLEIVQRYVNEDAEGGHPLAELLKDKLARKVVKQTVMTTVYGVTFIGARAQIASQLKDKEGIDETQVYECSVYLTRKVFLAVRSLFEGAHLIQDWLGDSAAKIAKSVRLDIDSPSKRNGNRPDFMSSVIWTTPLGLPIVQPYREQKRLQVSTRLQSVQLVDPYALRGVNARKQKTAFPPNYIHSLDASHMLLSAAECGRQNLQFASVHDSYWTHAADVDKMNEILRNAFISLHEVDLIAQLKNEFDQRYGGMLEYGEIPRSSAPAQRIIKARQDLSIMYRARLQNEGPVKAGKKAKSKKVSLSSNLTVAEEISIERERIELLASSEPEDVARGKSMATPLSIIESLSSEELSRLVQEASSTKKEKVVKSKTSHIKSTEHAGSGYDKQLAELELLDEEPEEEIIDEVSAGEEDSGTATKASKATGLSSLNETKSNTNVGVFLRLSVDQVPPKGTFDVKELRKSKYFFS